MEIIDYLLARKKAGGSDVTIEQLSVTENGTYSEEGIAYSPVVVNVPAPENSYQLTDIPAGAVSTIEDGTDLPMSSLKVGIEPVQDLHGYDHPWVGGAGKNKLNNVRTTTSINGITFTVNDDGSVFIAGGQTASDTSILNLIANDEKYYNLTDFGLNYDVDYSMNGCPSGGDANSYRLIFRSGGSAANIVDSGSGANFNISSESSTLVWMPCIIISSGYTIPSGGLLFKPMIRLATETDATFEPYSNICPIEGWTAANVTRSGKNLYKAELDNYYLDTVTGLPVAEAGYEVSEFIPISANQSIYIPQSDSARRWFYDKFKNPKTYLQNADNQIYTAQEDGYIRITLNKKASLYSTYQIEYGSTATTYEPYNGQTYTIEFKDGDNPLTVYGGTLDVTTGELVVNRKLVNMGNLSWAYDTSYDRFASNNIPDSEPPSGARITSFISSIYEVIDDGRPISQVTSGQMYSSFDSTQTSAIVMVHDNRFTDATEFKTAVTGQTFVYELATHTTYHLTPTQVRTLVRNNNIWADTGDVLSGKYFKEL